MLLPYIPMLSWLSFRTRTTVPLLASNQTVNAVQNENPSTLSRKRTRGEDDSGLPAPKRRATGAVHIPTRARSHLPSPPTSSAREGSPVSLKGGTSNDSEGSSTIRPQNDMDGTVTTFEELARLPSPPITSHTVPAAVYAVSADNYEDERAIRRVRVKKWLAGLWDVPYPGGAEESDAQLAGSLGLPAGTAEHDLPGRYHMNDWWAEDGWSAAAVEMHEEDDYFTFDGYAPTNDYGEEDDYRTISDFGEQLDVGEVDDHATISDFGERSGFGEEDDYRTVSDFGEQLDGDEMDDHATISDFGEKSDFGEEEDPQERSDFGDQSDFGEEEDP